jgi:glycosyltransferase involved in cell wall biosynthesis
VVRLRLDVLHSPDFIPPAFGYRHSVITVHDLNFLHYPQFLTAESRRYYNQQIKWAVRRADHILSDSHATKDDLTRLLDVPADKITVAHLAADPAFRPLSDAEVARTARRYELRPGFILFVGTLEPRKNVPGLLQAYRQLIDAQGRAPSLVLIGGRGWLYDKIFEQIEQLHLAERVRFLHSVPDSDLVALYNAARVLASPSFYEGFGLPALEAMACGTPVVAADRASLPEVVGDAGLLIDPENPEDLARALSAALTDDELHAQLSAQGLKRAGAFTWEKTARITLDVYRHVTHL